MDKLLWLVVGFVAGSVGGAAASEAVRRCGCEDPWQAGNGQVGNGNGANGDFLAIEDRARKALQYAEDFGYDALSEAQLLAIKAWEAASGVNGAIA